MPWSAWIPPGSCGCATGLVGLVLAVFRNFRQKNKRK